MKRINIKPIILKLGGSVITDKGKLASPNMEAIERLAGEIFQANVSSLILVHGGGSFGHPLAEKYKINEGYGDPSQIMGFAETHRAMTKLNNLVMDALMRHDITAVGVQPSSCVITKSGRIEKMELTPITRMLDMQIMPVLYGDAVLDSEKGFTILSGDQLVTSLAINFGASCIIMGGDVDGIYTADPKDNSLAKLVPHITLRELRTYKHGISGSKVTDVTGGMLGKIRELIPAIERNVQIFIVNATKPFRICKALRREKVISSIIEKGEINE